jgi:predicted AlkP superfamily pyrophosphatase or phosphodiesterase
MLPAIPSTFGRLSDVFISSLGAIIGTENRLNFRAAKRVIVVLVDGLGAHNLKAAAGHAPFLNSALAKTKPIACGFPSTTATSITSFGTGLAAGQHGLVGYKIFDQATRAPLNLLNGWNDSYRAEDWQPHQTVAEKAVEAGVVANFIGPKAYQGSGFTSATMRGTRYLAGKTIADRFEVAEELLRTDNSDSLTYLYVPELDQTAHAEGVDSARWLTALEDLEAAVRGLVSNLRKTDALLLTADHGVIDVPHRSHRYLDEFDFDWDRAATVAGDPRVNFIYLHDATEMPSAAQSLQEEIGDTGLALTRDQVKQAGWYGPLTAAAEQRLPDVFLLATKNVAYYHREYAPTASVNMIGQHGALSATEMTIPLLGWGAFA